MTNIDYSKGTAPSQILYIFIKNISRIIYQQNKIQCQNMNNHRSFQIYTSYMHLNPQNAQYGLLKYLVLHVKYSVIPYELDWRRVIYTFYYYLSSLRTKIPDTFIIEKESRFSYSQNSKRKFIPLEGKDPSPNSS